MIDKTLMLFAGTTEGRSLCEYLAQSGCITHVYVATEYGRELLPENDSLIVHTGKLDGQQMCDELKRIKPDIVLDATHPYAEQVTHNIRAACVQAEVSYIRVLRECVSESDGGHENDSITYVDTMEEAVNLLNSEKYINENILLTTGSKNISEYMNINNYRERAYLRLLPTSEMIHKAENAGFNPAHLIGMQGPFTVEFNMALIRQLHIDILVTKESGSNGGYEEKIEAVKNTDIEAVVLKRPVEKEGMSLSQVIEYLKEWEQA